MAKKRYNVKKKSKGAKMQPAITTLQLKTDMGTTGDARSYIDVARELSRVNRRLYSQSRLYGIQGLTYIFRQDPTTTVATIEVSARTAGNTWIVQNAHTKAHALWDEMQEEVLDDNPSIAGKWRDFKVRLCNTMNAAKTLSVRDGSGALYGHGEWEISKFVMPQHDVDPATGQPLAAQEFTTFLLGDDTASQKGLVKAYEDSRSTVFPDAPNVPADFDTSFFVKLTDSGSQEPELAAVIEDENNNPPYELDHYPGGPGNAGVPVTVGYSAVSTSEVDGHIGGFVAPCGLIELEVAMFDSSGNPILAAQMPELEILLHVAPGNYKGVAAIPMGQ